MSDMIKSHEAEIHAIQVKNEKKQGAIMKEMEQELRANEEILVQEKTILQAELQADIDILAEQLLEAKNNRSSTKDVEEIQSL